MGQRIYYYLTGDGRTADMLATAAELGMSKYGWGGYPRIPQRWGHSDGHDGLGTALQAILIAWERTGEQRYRDALRAAVAADSPVRSLLRATSHWNIGMTTSFGAMQAVAEYARLSGDAAARRVLLEAAARVKTLKRRHWMWPGSFHFIVAEALRLTGDAAYRRLADKMVKTQMEKRLGFNSIVSVAEQIYALEHAGEEGRKTRSEP